MLVSKQILHARPHLILQDIHVLLLFHDADHLVNAADAGGSKTSPSHDASPTVLDCFPCAAVRQLLSRPTTHVHSSVKHIHVELRLIRPQDTWPVVNGPVAVIARKLEPLLLVARGDERLLDGHATPQSGRKQSAANGASRDIHGAIDRPFVSQLASSLEPVRKGERFQVPVVARGALAGSTGTGLLLHRARLTMSFEYPTHRRLISCNNRRDRSSRKTLRTQVNNLTTNLRGGVRWSTHDELAKRKDLWFSCEELRREPQKSSDRATTFR